MPAIFLNLPILTKITGKRKLFIEGETVNETLGNLEETFPGIKNLMINDSGNFQGYLIVVAHYADESSSVLVKNPEEDRRNLRKLSILPIPHGG